MACNKSWFRATALAFFWTATSIFSLNLSAQTLPTPRSLKASEQPSKKAESFKDKLTQSARPSEKHSVLAETSSKPKTEPNSKLKTTETDGTASGGGGVGNEILFESTFESIRNSILKWVRGSAPYVLRLPLEMSPEKYRELMLRYLINPERKPEFEVVVEMVTTHEESTTSDPERQAIIDGVLKTCRGFISLKDRQPHILCNMERFFAEPTPSKYALVHHEFASLAGIEINVGPKSDYRVSKQVPNYLGSELRDESSTYGLILKSTHVNQINGIRCQEVSCKNWTSIEHQADPCSKEGASSRLPWSDLNARDVMFFDHIMTDKFSTDTDSGGMTRISPLSTGYGGPSQVYRFKTSELEVLLPGKSIRGQYESYLAGPDGVVSSLVLELSCQAY